MGHPGVVGVHLTSGRRGRKGLRGEGTRLVGVPLSAIVPCLVFLITRLFYVALGRLAPHILAPGPNSSILPQHGALASAWNWASTWFRFDSSWYVGVAQHGYHRGALGVANTNFFPLYPLLIRAVQPLVFGDIWLAAWLVANAAYLVALVYLWRWADVRWTDDTRIRFLILFAVFPFSLFFFVAYAEPVFLAAAAAAFYYAERNRWGPAIVAGALAASARPVGIAVVIALVLLALEKRGPRMALAALLSAAPLVAFVAYLTVAFGRPLAFLTYHSAGWVAPQGGLLATFSAQFHTNLSPLDRVDAAMVVLFLVSAVLVWRSLGRAYGTYVAIGVLLPLAHGLVSMERYVAVLFPAMAVWASRDNKALQVGMFALSVVALLVSTIMFASGYSVF